MNLLDNPEAIRRIDRSDMLGRVSRLAEESRQGWTWGREWEVPARWAASKELLVLGMGGSAIGGEFLLNLLAEKISRPIHVNRTYTLPAWVRKGTLVLASSYSGNTEETLSACAQAYEKGCRIFAVTSGGALARWARRRGLPVLLIPQGLPPRTALGFLAFVPLGALARFGWVGKETLGVEKACRNLERFVEFSLGPGVPTATNPAKKMARQIQGRLPILYGAAGGFEALTYRWRTQLEENAKTLAFHHLFPEATHNEISGWDQPRAVVGQSAAIFLKDPAIHPRTLRRMDFTAALIRRQRARVMEVAVSGGSVLERMLKLIALGDFVSVYLGLLYGADPTPVHRVEALKKFMKKASSG